MNINYYSKNYEIGEEVKGYVEEKMQKLKKFISPDKIMKVDIRFEKNTKHQNDEQAFSLHITINNDGDVISVEKTAKTTFEAIDRCEDAINSIVRKNKDQEISQKRLSKDEILKAEEEVEDLDID